MRTEIYLATKDNLIRPLRIFEAALQEGKLLSDEARKQIRSEIESGRLEILVACDADHPEYTLGAVAVAYRVSFSTGEPFASIEEIHVRPEAQGQGVGRALMQAVKKRCLTKNISYVEVQTTGEAADFYAALGYDEEVEVRIMSCSYPLRLPCQNSRTL